MNRYRPQWTAMLTKQPRRLWTPSSVRSMPLGKYWTKRVSNVAHSTLIFPNVATATALEEKKAPCIYRIHDRPTGDKLMNARGFLEAFGLSLPKEGVAGPAQLNHLLTKAKEMPTGFMISEIILRCQAQAVYHP